VELRRVDTTLAFGSNAGGRTRRGDFNLDSNVGPHQSRDHAKHEHKRDDIRIAPAYLMRLHVIVVEIPEGSWGAGGQTIDTEKISKLIGATEGPVRLAEALELGEKTKNARLS
jgi:hypothetical protein